MILKAKFLEKVFDRIKFLNKNIFFYPSKILLRIDQSDLKN